MRIEITMKSVAEFIKNAKVIWGFIFVMFSSVAYGGYWFANNAVLRSDVLLIQDKQDKIYSWRIQEMYEKKWRLEKKLEEGKQLTPKEKYDLNIYNNEIERLKAIQEQRI